MSESEEQTFFSIFEEELKLPKGLILGLLTQDNDWSFLIKTHALVDAALAHILVHELKRKEIIEYIERLNWGGLAGKLELSQKLKVINDLEKNYLEVLNSLRNKMAHNIRNSNFDMATYFDGKNKESNKLVDKYVSALAKMSGGKKLHLRDAFLQNPRNHLFSIGFILIAKAFQVKTLAKKSPAKIADDFGKELAKIER